MKVVFVWGVTGYQEIVHDDFFYSILKDEVNLTV